MSAPVTFNTVPARGGFSIGHAELDVPETLNSLSLEMVRLLHPALDEWAANPEIAAVVITAAGDRAFCAGGDIQALYRAIEANHAADTVVNDYPFRFFEEEYRLDYAIHQFPKPVITVGHGIVMGGGLGIFGASEFRVVTEKSRLAVPEITIGLFPDAGGTWTLGRMPRHWASFLGLTGSQIHGLVDEKSSGLSPDIGLRLERGARALAPGRPARLGRQPAPRDRGAHARRKRVPPEPRPGSLDDQFQLFLMDLFREAGDTFIKRLSRLEPLSINGQLCCFNARHIEQIVYNVEQMAAALMDQISVLGLFCKRRLYVKIVANYACESDNSVERRA